MPVTPTAPTLGDCYTLTPGIKYTLSDKRTILNVAEAFNGTDAFAQVRILPDGGRLLAFYQSISGGFIHQLGNKQYSDTGVLIDTEVDSASAEFSITTAPGQTFAINYSTSHSNPARVPQGSSSQTDNYLFVGFEDVTLAGQVFANTCKMSMLESFDNQRTTYWIAKGFGLIRFESQDAQGVPVAGSRVDLTGILSAP